MIKYVIILSIMFLAFAGWTWWYVRKLKARYQDKLSRLQLDSKRLSANLKNSKETAEELRDRLVKFKEAGVILNADGELVFTQGNLAPNQGSMVDNDTQTRPKTHEFAPQETMQTLVSQQTMQTSAQEAEPEILPAEQPAQRQQVAHTDMQADTENALTDPQAASTAKTAQAAPAFVEDGEVGVGASQYGAQAHGSAGATDDSGQSDPRPSDALDALDALDAAVNQTDVQTSMNGALVPVEQSVDPNSNSESSSRDLSLHAENSLTQVHKPVAKNQKSVANDQELVAKDKGNKDKGGKDGSGDTAKDIDNKDIDSINNKDKNADNDNADNNTDNGNADNNNADDNGADKEALDGAKSSANKNSGNKNNTSQSSKNSNSQEKTIFDAKSAREHMGKRIKQDDLRVVEGIGPKIANLFIQADIDTWQKLADTSVASCQHILDGGGGRYSVHSPQTWPEQAALAAQGDWAALKNLQDQLKGGRRV